MFNMKNAPTIAFFKKEKKYIGKKKKKLFLFISKIFSSRIISFLSKQVLWCIGLTMVHHTPNFTHIQQMWLNALLDVAKPIW